MVGLFDFRGLERFSVACSGFREGEAGLVKSWP